MALRSRLAVHDVPVKIKGASQIEFTSGIHTCHQKRFNTTNMTVYTGEPCDPRTNPGILSHSTRFRHQQQAK
eukprot:NODE_9506_length_338_cov_200.837456.p2 GENE.NODE_9506_length_338_cov_200.837456~~NODE_9506_length_338_cov_200.837456.p2  ORF type:complete len:84 (-),score=26.81 NODE_9506_length_338_cov_200.837456:87-302(-)